MTRFSRRHFLATAGFVATAPLLKGCLGNPPTSDKSASSPATTTSASVPSAVKPGEEPEVKTAKIGYLPIVEAAPLIVAFTKGFFAKHGMTDIKIGRASCRERVLMPV